MRRLLPLAAMIAALAANMAAFTVVPAKAEIWSAYGINGNDTGGIIPWTPALRAHGYRTVAQHHCGGYRKVARITSVVAGYGNYVGFACEFPRGYDPVKQGTKQGTWWWQY